ncbi:MAG: iron ABC transporter permease [Devosia sp.]
MSASVAYASKLPRAPIGAILLVLIMGLPLFWLAGAALLSLRGENGIAAVMLPIAVRETGLLMLAVGLGTGFLGLAAAWLVTHCEFPLRRVFDWALVLPLAIPTYLAAYCFTEVLDFTGPVQQALRALIRADSIDDYWFPQIRSNAGAAIVLSLVLYPYVYLSCRAFFLMQSGSASAAARTLGADGLRAFFTILLPLSRPALIVGITLAMLEVLSDLGAVQYFGVNSLTAVIYSTWINRSSFGGAAQLAVTIVLIVGLLIFAERWARNERLYLGYRDSKVPPPRQTLKGIGAVLALAFCSALLLAGFLLPVGELLSLARRRLDSTTLASVAGAFGSTMSLALSGALLTMVVGFYAARRGGKDQAIMSRAAIRFATLGYAIPGTVLALGLLQPLGYGDRAINGLTRWALDFSPGLILSGSVVALLYVYCIRFLAIAHSTLAEGAEKRGPSMLDAGRVLGARGISLLLRVDLPTLVPALLAAGTLVFVEIVKELPATLLLRPLGVETLSTLVYAKANTGLFAEAALPALAIVIAGLIPIVLAGQLSDRRHV